MLRSSSIYIIITIDEYVPNCLLKMLMNYHYDDT